MLEVSTLYQIIIGHVGAVELAAAAIGITWCRIPFACVMILILQFQIHTTNPHDSEAIRTLASISTC